MDCFGIGVQHRIVMFLVPPAQTNGLSVSKCLYSLTSRPHVHKKLVPTRDRTQALSPDSSLALESKLPLLSFLWLRTDAEVLMQWNTVRS